MRKWDFYLKNEEDFLDSTLRQPSNDSDEAILYLHGWGGDREVQSGLLDNLCEAGFYVLNFNQRGFSPSTGKTSLSRWHVDASTMTGYLRSQGLRVWICGLSTGGSMAISTMSVNKEILGGIVMSPFTSLDQLFTDKPALRDRLNRIFGQLTEEDFNASNTLVRLEQIGSRSIIIMCGDSDETIPSTHSKMLKDKAGSKAILKSFPGGNHVLSTVPPSELSHVVTDWIAKTKHSLTAL